MQKGGGLRARMSELRQPSGTADICDICAPKACHGIICVVEDVADLLGA